MSSEPNTLAAAEAAFAKKYPRLAEAVWASDWETATVRNAYLDGWADALHAAGLQTELDLSTGETRGAE